MVAPAFPLGRVVAAPGSLKVCSPQSDTVARVMCPSRPHNAVVAPHELLNHGVCRRAKRLREFERRRMLSIREPPKKEE